MKVVVLLASKFVSLTILVSSASKPEYLVKVDIPTSRSVVFIVPSTYKFPRPVDSVPIPTAPSFKLNDPMPIR